jgi:hypothetical protein
MGIASLHPSCKGCFASRATTFSRQHLRHVNPTGKSAKTCPVPRTKINRFTRQGKSRLNPLVSPDARGDRDRHERAVGCGGRGGALDETRSSRTVKSCGPGAPMLASSSREVILATDGGNKAGHRGEREVSRKPIAQGKPECFRWTCMLVCALLCTNLHTRSRVQRAPGFPCALVFEGAETDAKLGRSAPRERGVVSSGCFLAAV